MRPETIHPHTGAAGRTTQVGHYFPAGLRSSRWGAARGLAFIVLLLGPLQAQPSGEPAPLRFGFSAQLFADVNESDTRAALRIWAQTLGAERGIPVDPMLAIFTATGDIGNALLDAKTDLVTMTTAEYWALRRVMPLGPIVLGRSHGTSTVEYVLLVHRDNPAARLAELRGQSLNIMAGARAGLAAVWLETLLLEEKLGVNATFWGRTTHFGKLSRNVLPVFFHQADACVITSEGFRTMCELNPQVGRQLKVLAQSPAMVPAVSCFRGDLVSTYRDKLIAGIGQITETPAGRQTLALFQADQIEVRPVSDLDTACALLDRHQRLLAEAGDAQTANPIRAALPADDARSR